jgi:hypothetical protein
MHSKAVPEDLDRWLTEPCRQLPFFRERVLTAATAAAAYSGAATAAAAYSAAATAAAA